MPTLTRVTIQGFRSIKDASVDLGPLNVLIGANGAGKSNLVAFFRMLGEMMRGRLQLFMGRTGATAANFYRGPKITTAIDATVRLADSDGYGEYYFTLVPAAGDSVVFEKEGVCSKLGDYAPTAVLIASGNAEAHLGLWLHHQQPLPTYFADCSVYHFHDTTPTAQIRLGSELSNNFALESDGSNLASMLHAYRQSAPFIYRRIVSAVAQLVPSFGDFVLEPDRANPNKVLLHWRGRESDYILGPHQFSDGSLRAIAIIALLLQPEADLPKLIVLDEPELGLHPHALETIAGLIRAASLSTQVLVATQSPSFIDHFRPEDIIVAESNGDGSQFRRLDAAQLAGWLEDYSLGELWKRNVIGGGPLP